MAGGPHTWHMVPSDAYDLGVKAANKVLVVTGAGSGMGREVALEAVRRGAKVAPCDINETTLHRLNKRSQHAVSHRLGV